jgi:hypothetical protein
VASVVSQPTARWPAAAADTTDVMRRARVPARLALTTNHACCRRALGGIVSKKRAGRRRGVERGGQVLRELATLDGVQGDP